MIRAALRRPWIVLALAPLALGWSFFDPFHKHVEEGNRKAKAGDAPAAVEQYDGAARVDPSSPIPDFNKGVALAKGGDAAAARDALLAAAASQDAGIAADALYNLGNVYLEGQQYGEAVDSYLKSLDLDPADPDARRNLEIALRQLQQQQQQQPQQQQQQDDPEQGEDGQQQQQPQEQGDEPPPEPQPQENEEPQSEPTPQDSTQAPRPERFSREDAERLLNAIQGDELKVLDQLRDQDPEPGPSTHDW